MFFYLSDASGIVSDNLTNPNSEIESDSSLFSSFRFSIYCFASSSNSLLYFVEPLYKLFRERTLI